MHDIFALRGISLLRIHILIPRASFPAAQFPRIKHSRLSRRFPSRWKDRARVRGETDDDSRATVIFRTRPCRILIHFPLPSWQQKANTSPLSPLRRTIRNRMRMIGTIACFWRALFRAPPFLPTYKISRQKQKRGREGGQPLGRAAGSSACNLVWFTHFPRTSGPELFIAHHLRSVSRNWRTVTVPASISFESSPPSLRDHGRPLFSQLRAIQKDARGASRSSVSLCAAW